MTATNVLLITYNRPDLVHRQLELLEPQKLIQDVYVANDGAKNTAEDAARVSAVRQVVEAAAKNSKHRYHTLFAKNNQGCQRGVEAAIDWFFKHVDRGIILEDDCQPHPDFFRYATDLLLHYQDDQRVGMISGTKPVINLKAEPSYFFSRHSIIWGWATWRSAWQEYHHTKKHGLSLIHKPEVRSTLLQQISPKQLTVIEKVLNGEIDTWDYIWYLTNLLQSRYCIIPHRNLISNMGFLPDATHTKIKTTQSQLPLQSIKFPLKHPMALLPNTEFDQEYLNQQKMGALLLSVATVQLRDWAKKLGV